MPPAFIRQAPPPKASPLSLPQGRESQVRYQDYLRSKEWDQRRREALERRSKCWICSSDENLQVHHLTYERLGHEYLEQLETLCDTCHRGVHRLMRQHPELTYLIATYVFKRVEVRGESFKKACREVRESAHRIRYKRRVSQRSDVYIHRGVAKIRSA